MTMPNENTDYERWRDACVARDRAEQQARRAYLDGLHTVLRAEIDAATAALADLNRRTLRDLLRSALAAHPSVQRVAINQYTEFNDDTYEFSVAGFWLDETYVSLDLGLASIYEPFAEWSPQREQTVDPPGFAFGTELEVQDRWAQAEAASPPETSNAELLAQVHALERRTYGPLYDVAADIAARLRTLAPFGRHFWVVGFGYAATIEATSKELRISSAYLSHEHGPIAENRTDWFEDRERHHGIPLGNVTPAYASDPARAPHVARRVVRTPDLVRVERELTDLSLKLAATAHLLPHPLHTFWYETEFGEVKAVGVGMFGVATKDTWAGGWSADDEALAALVGTERTNEHGHAATFTDEAAAALRAWAEAVRRADDRFGHVRFANGGRTGRFSYSA